MKRVSVLLDLGFVMHKLYRQLGHRHANADEIQSFASKCIAEGEELFRTYCYHCPPYDGKHTHPFTRGEYNFKDTEPFKRISELIRRLETSDTVAFRRGELIFNGWAIGPRKAEDIAKKGRAITEHDFTPDLEQKRVDIKIGLDVAWLASKQLVERIVLVTGDSDFVPAMKFARREGVQVVLVTMNHHVKRDLRVHADEVREVKFP